MTTSRHQYITQSGMKEMKQRLAELRSLRTAAIDEMRDLTSSSAGSTLEDSILTLHRDRVIELDSQISYIENILTAAKVIGRPSSTTQVEIGSQVTVDMGGTERTYSIVGSLEADPAQGKMSNESPFGRLLLGKKVNDRIEMDLNRRSVTIKILAIA